MILQSEADDWSITNENYTLVLTRKIKAKGPYIARFPFKATNLKGMSLRYINFIIQFGVSAISERLRTFDATGQDEKRKEDWDLFCSRMGMGKQFELSMLLSDKNHQQGLDRFTKQITNAMIQLKFENKTNELNITTTTPHKFVPISMMKVQRIDDFQIVTTNIFAAVLAYTNMDTRADGIELLTRMNESITAYMDEVGKLEGLLAERQAALAKASRQRNQETVELREKAESAARAARKQAAKKEENERLKKLHPRGHRAQQRPASVPARTALESGKTSTTHAFGMHTTSPIKTRNE